MSHEYVLVETIALVHSRLGAAAVGRLRDRWLPLVAFDRVPVELRTSALDAVVAAVGRKVSFVDRVSFAFMRSQGIDRAFAFDADFGAEGFELAS